jgi:hypothetical protein
MFCNWSTVLICALSNISPVVAVTATGVVCKFSVVRRAVTTTSSMAVAGPREVALSADCALAELAAAVAATAEAVRKYSRDRAILTPPAPVHLANNANSRPPYVAIRRLVDVM